MTETDGTEYPLLVGDVETLKEQYIKLQSKMSGLMDHIAALEKITHLKNGERQMCIDCKIIVYAKNLKFDRCHTCSREFINVNAAGLANESYVGGIVQSVEVLSRQWYDSNPRHLRKITIINHNRRFTLTTQSEDEDDESWMIVSEMGDKK